jgi:hypothetical protein
MCTTNRLLSGALVYLPGLQCCAVIGHCCADKEQRDQAEREYKRRTLRDYEETLLLTTLPLIPARAISLGRLRPAAEEARRLYRKFRKEARSVHGHLRELKARRGGYLNVTELIEGEREDDDVQNYGPTGFSRRRKDDALTREIEFGMFAGQIAVIKDFNPVKELDDALRILLSLDVTPTEEHTLEFIVGMTEKQRHAAVAIIEAIDSERRKLIARLHNCAQFFARENIEPINSYGSHPSNPFPIEAKYDVFRGQPRVAIKHRGELCLLLVGQQLNAIEFEWPSRDLTSVAGCESR